MDELRIPGHAEFRAALDEIGLGGERELVRQPDPQPTRAFGSSAPVSVALLWALGGAALLALGIAWLGRSASPAGAAPPEDHDSDTLAARSRALASEGRFAEASSARYEELLVALEGRGLLRRHHASTGRAYQRQLPAAVAERFGALLRQLYPTRYGGVTMNAESFELWDRTATQLEESA